MQDSPQSSRSLFERIHFQSIDATDVERARDFYVEKLGFRVERDAPYGDSRWIFVEIPDAETLLHFNDVDEIAPQDTPALVLVTGNVDVACDELERRGVPIHMGPDDAPWEPGIRWAMIHDSEGNLVLIQTVKS
ncbi:VOC family protein [Psychromarinibacter sp. C21-152]|uniref:VOC family protein n=1 Tax=Psychromarinibacter sediminicola TaxID=3033385 RepID=A0AAE3NP67_9RHOB|nr:VOC family protein [Psychromarinibacter sediminicola]MDF0599561.1 VOC family protein [Psychromarinibacter sediminicola]